MINLKLTKKEKKKQSEPATIGMENEYPWGTRLSFEDPIIQKSEFLKNIKGGAMVEIRAVGKVVEVRYSDTEKGRTYERIEIQLQKIDFGSADEAEEAFKE